MKSESTKSTGRRGGLETLKKHGKEHFSKIAKEMWQKKKENQTEKLTPKNLDIMVKSLSETK